MEPKITISTKQGNKRIPITPASKVAKPIVHKQKALPKTELSIAQVHTPKKTVSWRSTHRRSPIQSVQKQKQQKKQELVTVVLSILGAIIVGIIMGASLLTIFFNDEQTYSQNSIDSHLRVKPNQKPAPKVNTLRVYLLQAGNFQHKEKAEAKVRSYRKQGLAAVTSAKAPFRIYLGVSLDQAGAEKLADFYKQKGTSVYLKPVDISSSNQNKGSVQRDLLQKSQTIFSLLSKQSIEGIQASPKTATKFTVDSEVTTSYHQVLSSAQNAKSKLSKADQESLMTMMQALDQAVQSAKEASIHPNTPLMWQIQEGLVRYVMTLEAFQS